jgi:hypothetical protein
MALKAFQTISKNSLVMKMKIKIKMIGKFQNLLMNNKFAMKYLKNMIPVTTN